MGLFTKKVQDEGDQESLAIDKLSNTLLLVMGALLGTIAFLLQSAGVFAGIGYIFSMMSTLPIVLASHLSIRIGMMTYFVTIFLLLIFQPSELWVFPFTTGLLGIGLGIGLKFFHNRILVILFTSLCLTLGISILLYGLKFPILGPSVTSQFNILVPLIVLIFSVIYSGLWMLVTIPSLKLFEKIVFRR